MAKINLDIISITFNDSKSNLPKSILPNFETYGIYLSDKHDSRILSHLAKKPTKLLPQTIVDLLLITLPQIEEYPIAYLF